MATTRTDTFRRIPGWECYELWQAGAGQRAQTTYPSGYIGAYTLRRATRCRCCGQSMPKGTPVLRVAYDIYQTGSSDPIRGHWMWCFLHAEPCRAVRPIEQYALSQLA